MSFVDDFFITEESTSVIFKTLDTRTITNGVPSEKSYTTLKTVNCLYWIGSAAESLVSEKYKTLVDAIVVLDYDSDIDALTNKDLCTINSVDYAIIDVNNVGNQNIVLEVILQRY